MLLACYWAVLFISTHVPREMVRLPRGVSDLIPHFIAYAVLAVLFAAALHVTVRQVSGWQICAAWMLLVVYAAIDEASQPLVGRHASVWDWLADAAGAAVGITVFYLWARRRRAMIVDSYEKEG
jgi:VanZ family protein